VPPEIPPVATMTSQILTPDSNADRHKLQESPVS